MKQLLVIVILLSSFSIYAQKGYKVIETKEGIEFSGKIKTSKKKPQVLFVKIKNTTSSDVGINFTLGLYWDAQIVTESESVHITVKQGKSIKGQRSNLVFPLYEFTTEQLKHDDFKIEITSFEATKLGSR